MRYGARNQIQVKVAEIKKGSAMSEVIVEFPGGGVMTSVMTIISALLFNISSGRSAYS